MNKEKLIAEMREEVKRQIAKGYLLPGSSEHIIEGFTEVALKHMPQWVKVDDRLPEDDIVHDDRTFSKSVLFTDGDNIYAGWYEVIKGVKSFWCEQTDSGSPIDASEITHWMPLPEPPKE